MKKISLYLMSVLYIVAGINHFASPKVYLQIMPPWVPFHLLMVDLTGVCEILFGILLIPLATRKTAAWLIIVLLIAIFPANIQMAINYYHENNPRLWVAIVRLPLQFVLIAWAYIFARPNSR